MSGDRPGSDGATRGAPRAARSWVRVAPRVLRRAAMNFVEDRGTLLAASISYYALFSLFPVVLLIVAIFGVVLRSEELQERVVDELVLQLPVEETIVADGIDRAASLGPTLTVISLFGALWTAGALSAAVRSALNEIFEVPRGRPLVRGKLMDYALLPIIGMPFLGGVILTTGWRILQRQAADVPLLRLQALWLWELGAVAISLLLSFTALLLLYWLIPNRRLQLRYIWAGALLAAILFELLKAGFAFYLANIASYDVVYGPLSGVIVLLFWVYLTANIMLFGAEVASETPHVVFEEPRHGHATGDEGNWRHAAWSFLRGLVLVQEEEVPESPQEEPAARPHERERVSPAGGDASARRRRRR